MRVCIVTPVPRGSRQGNRITALRWAGQLRSLGHSVFLRESWEAHEACDLLIALHAARSAASIERFHSHHPDAPLLLIITGTDIYGDSYPRELLERSLALATRVIALHADVLEELAPEVCAKSRVITQSASRARQKREAGPFDVCVVAHLRAVKDPLLSARAARLLPQESSIAVLHAGAALEAGWAEQAREEQRRNPRYRWLGDLRHGETLALIESCKLLVVSSISEGGPAVIPEAVVAGTAILSTAMPAALALLGQDYPGFFPIGDTEALADLLRRAETEPGFLELLEQSGAAGREMVATGRERAEIAALLEELPVGGR